MTQESDNYVPLYHTRPICLSVDQANNIIPETHTSVLVYCYFTNQIGTGGEKINFFISCFWDFGWLVTREYPLLGKIRLPQLLVVLARLQKGVLQVCAAVVDGRASSTFCGAQNETKTQLYFHLPYLVNPFRTAAPFWGQTTRNLAGLSPKRDCGSKTLQESLTAPQTKLFNPAN